MPVDAEDLAELSQLAPLTKRRVNLVHADPRAKSLDGLSDHCTHFSIICGVVEHGFGLVGIGDAGRQMGAGEPGREQCPILPGRSTELPKSPLASDSAYECAPDIMEVHEVKDARAFQVTRSREAADECVNAVAGQMEIDIRKCQAEVRRLRDGMGNGVWWRAELTDEGDCEKVTRHAWNVIFNGQSGKRLNQAMSDYAMVVQGAEAIGRRRGIMPVVDG